jgi:hypothetical protein
LIKVYVINIINSFSRLKMFIALICTYLVAGRVVHMGENGGAFRILVGEPEGRRPLGRPRRRWEDNIKMDLKELRWGHGLD